MRREDMRDLEAERLRRLRDRDRDDFGQADYSNTYGYDSRTRTGYRAYDDGRTDGPLDPRDRLARPAAPRGLDRTHDLDRPRDVDHARDLERSRSWDDGRHDRHDSRSTRRDGPSDRVLWAVVMERLDAERRLDLRDVQVEVVDGEVILNGVVRHKADKRRIEDIADIDGVRNVQNNLKARDRGRWTFL